MEPKSIIKIPSDYLSEDQELIPPELPRHRSSFSRKQMVNVICRIRPPFPQEEQAKFEIRKKESQLSVFDPNKNTEKVFSFNHVYDEHDSQYKFVNQVCSSIIDKFNYKGKGSLIFSYGVTNSGKTYTILGNNQNPGILPHLIRHLKGQIKIYAFELYNDQFFSLKNGERINFKDHGSFFDFINFYPQVIHENNMELILSSYMKNRTQGDTKANRHSSRSHAIFRIQFQGTVIGVVDLAGSERMNKAFGNAEETSIINKSLLSLGRCIKAMKDKSTNSNFVIPYRESKLTKVLYEFFAQGGQYGITMIANLSLASNSYHESLKVLEYAAIAHDIKYDQSKSPLSHKVFKSTNKDEVFRRNNQKQQLKSIMKSAMQKASKEVSKIKSKRKKSTQAQAQKTMKSVFQLSHKNNKKSYTENQSSLNESENQIEKEEYILKIQILNQELNRVNRIKHLQKMHQKLKQSQQDFEVYVDFHFQKEKEKANQALAELERLPYYSPCAQRRDSKQMDNQSQQQQNKFQLNQQQNEQIKKIVQKIENSQKKLQHLAEIKSQREAMRDQIQNELRNLLQMQRQQNNVDFGMTVGDSLKKINLPGKDQAISVKLQYEQAKVETPAKKIFQTQNDEGKQILNDDQKQIQNEKAIQKGVFSFLSYPVSYVKKSAQKLKDAVLQNFSSKNSKNNQIIPLFTNKAKSQGFQKKKQAFLLYNYQFFHGTIQTQKSKIDAKQVRQEQVKTRKYTNLNFEVQYEFWNGCQFRPKSDKAVQTVNKQVNEIHVQTDHYNKQLIEFLVQTEDQDKQFVSRKASLIEVSSDTEYQRGKSQNSKEEKSKSKSKNNEERKRDYQKCVYRSISHQKSKSNQKKLFKGQSKPAKSRKRPTTKSPKESLTPIKMRLRRRK